MSGRRVITWTLLALAVIALAVFGLSSKSSPPGGRRAPALPHEQLVGTPATLSSLIAGAGGHPVAVLFWASWCGPCKKEAPEIERFAKTDAGSGRIVGVDWSDSASEARSFIAHYHWSFPNLRDGEGTVGNSYRLTGLPTTFVLDATGHIRATLRGPQTQAALGGALAAAEGR